MHFWGDNIDNLSQSDNQKKITHMEVTKHVLLFWLKLVQAERPFLYEKSVLVSHCTKILTPITYITQYFAQVALFLRYVIFSPHFRRIICTYMTVF